MEVKLESSANKFADDRRRAVCDAKKVMADSYLEVLVSLKEKWEQKKAAADSEARLWEVVANIDLLKEFMNNNLLASDELLRLQEKEVELGSEVDLMMTSVSLSRSSTCPRFRRICPRISLLRFLLQRMIRRSARMTG